MSDTEIGLILVHGIGEQGRFEHLDTHIRGIIGGFKRSGARVTVEIMSAESAPFHSVQDTWQGGPEPSIRLFVRNDDGLTIVNVHEVWWADINEPYSIMKQLRFWVWGLSIWSYPGQKETNRSGNPAQQHSPAQVPGGWTKAWVRLRLFLIGWLFLIVSLTVGVASLLLGRLLNLKSFTLLRTAVNYLSSVKLYSQRHRRGAGPLGNADFLDTIGEPPRDSIRRRMIRTICDVACHANYARWFILAHSQGSVVAFNGLMEPGWGWVGYLDEARLTKLAGRGLVQPGGGPEPVAPARPLWSAPGEEVVRTGIFAKFAGMLTYGSPLEKFAAIWPGRVPVYKEPAFAPGTQWVNVYDPLDPVSGVIHSWDALPTSDCPAVVNIGYNSSGWVLLGHTKYLDCPYPATRELFRNRLADHVALWLLGDTTVFVVHD